MGSLGEPSAIDHLVAPRQRTEPNSAFSYLSSSFPPPPPRASLPPPLPPGSFSKKGRRCGGCGGWQSVGKRREWTTVFFLFEMIEGTGTTDTYLVDNIIGAWVRAGTKIIGGKKLVWSRTYKRQKVVNIKSFRLSFGPGPFVRSW